MKIEKIINILEGLSPLSYAEDFDNVGLLVGDRSKEVKGVLVTLDCLEQTIVEAIEKDCNLIVSFHPIVFKGLKRFTGATYVERVVMKAISAGIAIYSMHTALDNQALGVSHKMAETIGLQNTRVLMPQKGVLYKLQTYVPEIQAEKVRAAMHEAGAGQIGDYSHCSFNVSGTGTFVGGAASNPAIGERDQMEKVSEVLISVVFQKHLKSKVLKALKKAHPYEEVAFELFKLENEDPKIGMGMVGSLKEPLVLEDFMNLLKDRFKLKVIRHSETLDKPLKTIAVLGGSGSFAIKAAMAAGADAYVTADLKYHDFFQAESRMVLCDIGHYESEQFTKNLLAEYLTKKITNFAPALTGSKIFLAEKSTNPINYF